MHRHPRGGRARRHTVAAVAVAAALMTAGITGDAGAVPMQRPRGARITVPSLDGSGNNPRRPNQGRVGQAYSRVAPAAYADGAGAMTDGPSPRYISNRIFNDTGQNLFSARGVTQWGWAWGQFLDHTMGLAQGGTDAANLEFDASDPLEAFDNDFGACLLYTSPSPRDS